MRIVAGMFKGRTLVAPRGDATRPTSDKVRESLFAALDALNMLSDTEVLDTFAGSGALGLEALSRGAAHAVFVERAASALAALRTNVAQLGVAEQVTVLGTSAARAATTLEGRQFDLIFADPPYPMTEPEVTRTLAGLAPRLADDGSLIVLERSARSPAPALPDGLQTFQHRTYGETALWLLERMSGGPGTQGAQGAQGGPGAATMGA